jgi:REP element-mobilizing transposase RayT
MTKSEPTYLPRLEKSAYCGNAVVHWVLTTRERKQGWLDADFHGRFRELTLHACAREKLVCPVYCLMPDHMHFIWMGLRESSDQRRGMSFFRTYLNRLIAPIELNHQPFDHLLKIEEREQNAFARMCSYILENPSRSGLVSNTSEWAFSGAVVSGYPELNPLEARYWPLFWRLYYGFREALDD